MGLVATGLVALQLVLLQLGVGVAAIPSAQTTDPLGAIPGRAVVPATHKVEYYNKAVP
jgi:hypothetical protein